LDDVRQANDSEEDEREDFNRSFHRVVAFSKRTGAGGSRTTRPLLVSAF
jgi:hypothetical protein